MTNQGFGNMDDSMHRKIANEGGRASNKASNTAKNISQNLSDTSKKGAAAQSTEDKLKGGQNSHRASE